MARTRRYIFNTLTVVSLLLLVAGLWVDSRGHSTGLSVTLWSKSFSLGVHSDRTSVYFSVSQMGDDDYDTWHWATNRFDMQDSSFFDGDRWLAFQLYSFDDISSGGNVYVEECGVTLPHWFLTLIFAMVPAIWLFKWNKRRKLGPNACPSCGYDLRGNETGQCSECGVEIKSEAKAQRKAS